MRSPWTLLAVCALCAPLAVRPARAASAAVGVNVYDEVSISKAEQDAEIVRLAANGVKYIRTGLSAKTVDFITDAYKHGIGAVVEVYPTMGSKAKSLHGWFAVPMTQADPEAFTAWLKPILNQLDASGVRLTAMEVGNEINTSRFNGDIPEPGSGRALGVADLNNPRDAEAHTVADGLRTYLRAMTALKTLRDRSKMNNKTPIISAGLADWGPPTRKTGNNQLVVSLPDTIEFLRQNGMDKLVDGYGVHVYATGDPRATVASRVAFLEKNILPNCQRGGKPCWITEWGFANNSQACPVNDAARLQVIEAERAAFKSFIDEGRLVAIMYYTWSGAPNSFDPMGVYRCNALTAAGKAAIGPI